MFFHRLIRAFLPLVYGVAFSWAAILLLVANRHNVSPQEKLDARSSSALMEEHVFGVLCMVVGLPFLAWGLVVLLHRPEWMREITPENLRVQREIVGRIRDLRRVSGVLKGTMSHGEEAIWWVHPHAMDWFVSSQLYLFAGAGPYWVRRDHLVAEENISRQEWVVELYRIPRLGGRVKREQLLDIRTTDSDTGEVISRFGKFWGENRDVATRPKLSDSDKELTDLMGLGRASTEELQSLLASLDLYLSSLTGA